MRLLVFTNDYDQSGDLLGFLPGRVNALAGSVDGVHILSQHVGTFTRHPRVSVHEISKRKHPSRITRALLVIRKAWILRAHYDVVMVTMAPSWAVIFGLLTRLLGKRCVLWYAVWRGGFRLRLATLVCHRVLTSVPEAGRGVP